MTAHNLSSLNHVWFRFETLCAVIDRAYRGAGQTARSFAFHRLSSYPLYLRFNPHLSFFILDSVVIPSAVPRITARDAGKAIIIFSLGVCK